MLRKLGDWSQERNFWETLLFYLIYCASGIFVCGVLTSLIINWYSFASIDEVKQFVNRIAPLFAGGYAFFVSLLLIWFKKIGKDMLAVLCAIVGGLASMSLGLIFGFIPVAILSCFKPEAANMQEV